MENEAIVANADIVLRAITAQGKDAARERGLLDSCCNIAITPTTETVRPTPGCQCACQQPSRRYLRSFAQRLRGFPHTAESQRARMIFLLNVLAGGTGRASLATCFDRYFARIRRPNVTFVTSIPSQVITRTDHLRSRRFYA